MRGSLRKRGENWYGIIELPREADGKRKQKEVSLKTTSKKEADKKLAELLKQVWDGCYVDAPARTVSEFMNAYHNDVSKLRLRETAHEREGQIIRNQINSHIGHITLSALKPQHIQSMYTELLKCGAKNGKPLSARSVEYTHAVLHVALKHAVRTGQLATNPADRVEKPKPRNSEMKTLAVDELALLIKSLRGTQNFIPALIASTCGLRASEILGLRWSDVDLDRGTLTVQRVLSQIGSNVIVSELKTNSSRRTIPIPAFVIDELKQHKDTQNGHGQLVGGGYNAENLICPSINGDFQKPKSFASGVRDAIHRAGFNVRFHDLRHSHATVLAAQGASFKVIQERLGHANLSTTMNIYLHSSPNMQEEATKQFDETFKKLDTD